MSLCPLTVVSCVLLVCLVSTTHSQKSSRQSMRKSYFTGQDDVSDLSDGYGDMSASYSAAEPKDALRQGSFRSSGRHAGRRRSETGGRKQTDSNGRKRSDMNRRNKQSESGRRQNERRQSDWGGRRPPNIIMVLTDDQDVLLGSLNYMPKVQRLLIDSGAYFNNSFVPTPMCCPSRSSMLTGMYVHNHNVYTNNANCSGTQWKKHYESRSFATYINSSYTTGYFGKYLNEYNGDHTPAGWQRWEGLVRNSRFYNYTIVNEFGVKTRHGDNYYKDYLTDLVSKKSLAFLREKKQRDPSQPLMLVMSVPAPHGPEDAAPQYQHMFVNNTAHRTPAWNHAPNPDKQWLLKRTNPMLPQFKLFTDLLQRRRLQTLQSVDDMVEELVATLRDLRQLDNTYIIYTSDHGYHLGQFGLIKGKAMPFDFDTKVPLIVRGPGIKPGTVISNIVTNVDIAPTILDMAGQKVPDHMDGMSVMRLIKASRDPRNVDKKGFVTLKRPWRDTILFERGKLSEKIMKQRMRTEELSIYNQIGNDKNMQFYIPPRKRRLAKDCAKGQNRLPCKPQQKWYCIEHNGKLRKHKCKNVQAENAKDAGMQNDGAAIIEPCSCSKARMLRKLGRRTNKRQRRFLQSKIKREFRSKYGRMRRSATFSSVNLNSSQNPAITFSGLESMFNRRCRILANQSVLCDLDIYRKTSELESHKQRIDDMIKEYRKALEDLRGIRRHLKEQQPLDLEDMDDAADDWDEDDEDLSCDCAGLEESLTPAQRRRAREKEERMKQRSDRKKNRKDKRKKKNDYCNNVNMNCFTHDNSHWTTPPYWSYGPFCFCSNANNNTYWCLRTINETHDIVYCEFITTFMSFYDLIDDPFQLKNTVTELNYGIIQQLHESLKKLKHCVGGKDCYMHSSDTSQSKKPDKDWPGLQNLRRSSRKSTYSRNYFKESKEGYSDDVNDRKTKRMETKFSLDNLDYE